MKDKGMKEMKKKPQIGKVKVKSAYQMEKGKAGGNLTRNITKKMS
jgi:hypothetical protein